MTQLYSFGSFLSTVYKWQLIFGELLAENLYWESFIFSVAAKKGVAFIQPHKPDKTIYLMMGANAKRMWVQAMIKCRVRAILMCSVFSNNPP